MDSLLTAVGDRVAQRWASAVFGLGLVFVAACWVAGTLGHRHALDVDRLIAAARELADAPRRPTGEALLIAAGWLVGAGVASVAVQLVARLVETVWAGRLLPARAPTALVGRSVARLDRRIRAQYHGLRVGLLWPRLWLLMGDEERTAVGEARYRIRQSATHGGWALGYLFLGLAWWPALLIAAGAAAFAYGGARQAVQAYITLVEAAVDIHHRTIAEAFDLELVAGALSPDAAAQLNDRLHKTNE